MKKKVIMIEESLYEFSKRKNKISQKSRGIDMPDTWNDDEDSSEESLEDIDVDTSDMTNTEEIEVDDEKKTPSFDDVVELQRALNNELKIKETDRRVLTFSVKNDPEEKVYSGVPMAQLSKSDAYLFKLDNGQLKKFLIKDIILENRKGKNNRARTIND